MKKVPQKYNATEAEYKFNTLAIFDMYTNKREILINVDTHTST